LFNQSYRDKKVVGVFVRFAVAPLQWRSRALILLEKVLLHFVPTLLLGMSRRKSILFLLGTSTGTNRQ
jgi:hypothetical protein